MPLTFALYLNTSKPSDDLPEKVTTFLKSKGHNVLQSCEEITKAKSLTAIITFGGDGTILNMLHEWSHIKAPVLGINLGHLGFMADVQKDEYLPALEKLISGKFTVDERIMINSTSPSGKSHFSANDIVFHRGSNPSLVEIEIEVDGIPFNTFVADGIIVSTPNGSTAYSLAAGGPILESNLDALVITPISPHTISNRPFVLNADQTITIRYITKGNPLVVQTDGLPIEELPTGQEYTIKKSPKTFSLVNLDGHDRFATFRTKLSWTGKLK